MSAQIFGGRWEIIEPIGEGGQSHVYLVKDATDEYSEECVLKKLKNNNRIERFKQEVRAGIELNHAQIAPILDFNFDDKKPYFITKHYPGPTLTNLAPLRPLQALEIFIKICNPVAYAHLKGVVHRDLKPDNIIFDADRNPVILDFGICYFTDEDNRLTETMEQVGSRYYIAPELEDGRAVSVTWSADSYALGKILYFLLTGTIFARENYTGPNEISTLCKNSQLNYVTQRVLSKSVTGDPEQRDSVEELKQKAITIGRLLREHFYPGKDGSQCRFCGEGIYQPVTLNGLNVWNRLQTGSNITSPNDFRLDCEAIACDTCGNIQWFKLG